MRLAVDAHNVLVDHQGIGRYVRTLLRAFTRESELELTLLLRRIVPWMTARRMRRLLGSDRFALATRVPSDADVVWHPWNGTFFDSTRPGVVTMHDAVPFAFPASDPARRSHEQEPFLRSRSARLVIAVSHIGAREIVARVGVPEERVRVIYHGVAPVFSPAEEETGGRYLLFVGKPAQPLKNFALLHRAYVRAWPDGDGPELVVIGGDAAGYAKVRVAPLIREGGAAEADERMRDLYRGALALCVPSRFESFGMPVLEAMACGTPVLAARTGALPEIAADAALLLDVDDEAAWAAAIRAIAGDGALRARLRAAGLRRARGFRWERCAAQTLEVFREAIGAPAPT